MVNGIRQYRQHFITRLFNGGLISPGGALSASPDDETHDSKLTVSSQGASVFCLTELKSLKNIRSRPIIGVGSFAEHNPALLIDLWFY